MGDRPLGGALEEDTCPGDKPGASVCLAGTDDTEAAAVCSDFRLEEYLHFWILIRFFNYRV